jgi:hypothetical protein
VTNGVGVRLARNRRSPKRPSEPRPSGVHPEEDVVEKDGVAFRLRLLEGLTMDGLAGTRAMLGVVNRTPRFRYGDRRPSGDPEKGSGG